MTWMMPQHTVTLPGGLVVHGVGGTIALVNSLWLGPRLGRLRATKHRIVATLQADVAATSSLDDEHVADTKLRVTFRRG